MKVWVTLAQRLGITTAKANLPAATRRPRLTEDDTNSPTKLADVLTRILNAQQDFERASQASPLASGLVFVDLVFNGTDPQTLHHGFGRNAMWLVVDWQPASGSLGTSMSRTGSPDTETLTLMSTRAGTATVMVF